MMKKKRANRYYCNPMNISMRYSWNPRENDLYAVDRECADPTLVYFHDKYMLFPSMTAGFYVSEDLANWKLISVDELPAYDYAPDVRVIGEYLYFCASKKDIVCNFYRSKDPESGIFEKIEGTFPFWDPDLFLDDDGRVYLYWGCSNETPIYGIELDPLTMHRIGEPVPLIYGNPMLHGYERIGEENFVETDPAVIEAYIRKEAAKALDIPENEITDMKKAKEALPDPVRRALESSLDGRPWIEGAFMTKHNGRYYLQYAGPATEHNIYSDGCYEADTPLGPFHPSRNNPFSLVPGGFITGAGHGSTIKGEHDYYWHAASSHISVSDSYERRVGLWKAGFDDDGELFCNQRYPNFPIRIPDAPGEDLWDEPEWMLLSADAEASASSESKPASHVVEENIRTFWKAQEKDRLPVLQLKLKSLMTVSAIQVNFADDLGLVKSLPEGGELNYDSLAPRYIDTTLHRTRWTLEGSADGVRYVMLADKSEMQTDLPHDLIVLEKDMELQYIRLTVMEMPYGQPAAVSGLRVFGKGHSQKPAKAGNVKAVRTSPLDMQVSFCAEGVGAEILWGHAPDKLYHCREVILNGKTQINQRIGSLVAREQSYFIRVDTFNENGITQGDTVLLVPEKE